MKKKVLVGMCLLMYALVSVLGVTAANSPTANVTLNPSHQGYYEVRTGNAQFTNASGEGISVKQDILDYNQREKTLEQLLTGYDSVLQSIGARKPLTTVFDLHAVDGGQLINNEHRVKVYVPTLTDKCTDVVVLHYSVQDSKWEIIQSEFSVTDKTVTVITDDLSPIAIFATVSGNTQTGDELNTGLWAVLAIGALAVLAVVSIGMVSKKRR